jgi:hypothetical protein
VACKLHIFAWSLARSLLPTGAERERRHMKILVVCLICNAATDTWIHSCLDCHKARSVLALKDDETTLRLFADESHDPKLWLFYLSNTRN